MSEIKIGDTLYERQQYRRQGEGKWKPVKIVGETKMSWLYAPFGEGSETRIKINKKTMTSAADYRGMRDKYFTHDQTVNIDFCDVHRRSVTAAVEKINDASIMREIARLVGMELPS